MNLEVDKISTPSLSLDMDDENTVKANNTSTLDLTSTTWSTDWDNIKDLTGGSFDFSNSTTTKMWEDSFEQFGTSEYWLDALTELGTNLEDYFRDMMGDPAMEVWESAKDNWDLWSQWTSWDAFLNSGSYTFDSEIFFDSDAFDIENIASLTEQDAISKKLATAKTELSSGDNNPDKNTNADTLNKAAAAQIKGFWKTSNGADAANKWNGMLEAVFDAGENIHITKASLVDKVTLTIAGVTMAGSSTNSIDLTGRLEPHIKLQGVSSRSLGVQYISSATEFIDLVNSFNQDIPSNEVTFSFRDSFSLEIWRSLVQALYNQRVIKLTLHFAPFSGLDNYSYGIETMTFNTCYATEVGAIKLDQGKPKALVIPAKLIFRNITTTTIDYTNDKFSNKSMKADTAASAAAASAETKQYGAHGAASLGYSNA